VLTILFLCYRAFDAELLYIAQKLKIPISEVAVNWTEIEGIYIKASSDVTRRVNTKSLPLLSVSWYGD
jgi:hypothetical protein